MLIKINKNIFKLIAPFPKIIAKGKKHNRILEKKIDILKFILFEIMVFKKLFFYLTYIKFIREKSKNK